MSNKFTILAEKKYLKRQVLWIENQIKNYKEDSFLKYENARSEFERGMLNPMSSPKVIHAFVNEFLSETGLKRLNTSIKIFKKRQADKKSKSQKLEVILDLETLSFLEEIATKSGLTKTEIIKQLIKNEANRDADLLISDNSSIESK